jgi:AraC family transcriptional regulator of adaptative response/methylated-DNA-[protein]-cysteine methyltransferase
MTPTAYRQGGDGASIRFVIDDCWLGKILVAASGKGIRAILLGDNPNGLAHELQHRFSKARLIGRDALFEQLITAVVQFLEMPSVGLNLPLDIRGTAFQRRVWTHYRQGQPPAIVTLPSGSADQSPRVRWQEAVQQMCWLWSSHATMLCGQTNHPADTAGAASGRASYSFMSKQQMPRGVKGHDENPSCRSIAE